MIGLKESNGLDASDGILCGPFLLCGIGDGIKPPAGEKRTDPVADSLA